MPSNLIIRLRVLAILVVVAYHCACPYLWCWEGYQGNSVNTSQMVSIIFHRVLCNTMLPVFFMISGMLFYAKEEKYLNDRKATIWKKFDRLMIPYFIIFALCFWLDLPSIGVSSVPGHLWFVRALFVIFLISILLSKVPKWILMCLGGVFYVIFILCCKYSIPLHAMVEHFFNFYIFFIGGYFFEQTSCSVTSLFHTEMGHNNSVACSPVSRCQVCHSLTVLRDDSVLNAGLNDKKQMGENGG